MASYEVRVPVVGYYAVTVNAESEEEAIELGLQQDFNLTFEPYDKESNLDLVEFGVVNKVVNGNVCYAPLFYAEAELLD